MALALRRDAHHPAAKRYMEHLPAGVTLVTSDYVLDETLTRLRRVAGHPTAVRVGEALRGSSLARLLDVEREDIEEAWDLFRRFDDKELSFTDCTIIAMVRRLAVDAVFAFDEDFQRAGLKTVPG